jgi:adenylosuccinate synthase
MFNWYKYAQMSAINSLRLFDLDANFTLEELDQAFVQKKKKWNSLVGQIPEAEKILFKIDDAYEELKTWALHRSDKNKLDFYL